MAPVVDTPSRALVFIGFMGAGKTTVAGEVAAALGVRALDSDRLLEDELGHSVAEEFRTRGEASFRTAEQQLVCRLLEQAGAGSVIALGGGSILSESVRAALGPHLTVLLDIDAQAAWRRAGSGREKRPLASDREAFDKLHASRLNLYEGLAEAILPALTPRVGLRALPALSGLSRAPAGTRLLWASAASGDYPVLVGGGLLSVQLCSQAGIWPLDRATSRPYCVSDQNVAGLYAERLGGVQELIEIAPGESNKTLGSAELVWSALVAGGMTRADHIVALGGGVVGDLAGFCAATYQRGIQLCMCRPRSSRRRLRLRGQDRRRSAAGQELCRRLPSSGGSDCRPRDALHAARGRARSRLCRGVEDGVDRRRRAVAARRGGRAAG